MRVEFTAQKGPHEDLVFIKARHVSGSPGTVAALYRFGNFVKAFVISKEQKKAFESGKRINVTSEMIRKLEFYR